MTKKQEVGLSLKVLRANYGVPEHYVGRVGKIIEVRQNNIHGNIYTANFKPGGNWSFAQEDVKVIGSILNL